ncbi:unnamed protein product [Prorocentrum cordatum]|uniref:Cyclic nucleotide-binding domain-containing protein n=1 Tax=Prorocentrum cordatum TaxID=2364126 RepID=A0ABN9WN91_9DINO|nr:unnamed protein product [Polarella glacialis]
MIFGNGGMALFFISRIPSMKVPFIWAFLKVCINIFMVWKLLQDRQPVVLPPKELDIYEKYFMPFGVGPRQFRDFWNLGETCLVPPGTKIAVQGEAKEHVELVLRGHVFRLSDDKHIRGLDSVSGEAADVDPYSAGAWVGELRALQLLNMVSGPKAVSVSQELYKHRLAQVEKSRELDVEFVHAFSELWGGFGMGQPASADADAELRTRNLDELLQRSRAKWDVQAGEGVEVRRWELKPLLHLCMTDPDLADLIGKVWSQSVIDKMLHMDAAQMDLPSIVSQRKRWGVRV